MESLSPTSKVVPTPVLVLQQDSPSRQTCVQQDGSSDHMTCGSKPALNGAMLSVDSSKRSEFWLWVAVAGDICSKVNRYAKTQERFLRQWYGCVTFH